MKANSYESFQIDILFLIYLVKKLSVWGGGDC